MPGARRRCQGLAGLAQGLEEQPSNAPSNDPWLGSPGTLPQLGPCSPSSAAVCPGRAEEWRPG